MTSAEIVSNAIGIVREALARRGFKAKDGTFRCKVPNGNTVLVTLQKSRSSTAACVRVAINFGVYCRRLGLRLKAPTGAASSIWAAHWNDRYQVDGREKWWSVSPSDSPDGVASAWLSAIESRLPDVVQMSSDEALRDAWSAACASRSSVSIMMTLLHLAVLLDEIGPQERLPEVIRELRAIVKGEVQEATVEKHLARAGLG